MGHHENWSLPQLSGRFQAVRRLRESSDGDVFRQNESKLENKSGVHLQRSPRLDGWWAAWHTCVGSPLSAYRHVDSYCPDPMWPHIR